MIRAANGRKLKKLVEELFYKSNNTLFPSQIENKEKEKNKINKINYNDLKEKYDEEYNERED